jgi:hypothetical protein
VSGDLESAAERITDADLELLDGLAYRLGWVATLVALATVAGDNGEDLILHELTRLAGERDK